MGKLMFTADIWLPYRVDIRDEQAVLPSDS